jgi:hypothetical protein
VTVSAPRSPPPLDEAVELVAFEVDLLFEQRVQHHGCRAGVLQPADVADVSHSGEDEAPADSSVSDRDKWWTGRWSWKGRSFCRLLRGAHLPARAPCARRSSSGIPTSCCARSSSLGLLRIALDQHGVAGFVVDVILQLDAGRARIELEGDSCPGRQLRVIAEQRPVTGFTAAFC